MRAVRLALIAFAVVVLGTLLAALAVVTLSSPVSLTILGMSTNRWSDAFAARMGSQEYVCAVVGCTNVSTHPVACLAHYRAKFPDYRLLHQTPNGWEETQRRLAAGGVPEYFKLAPSQGFTFRAVLETGTVCKVALDYVVVSDSGGLFQSFSWLLPQRPPTNEWRVAITRPVKLWKTTGTSQARKESDRLPEWVVALQAAAEHGDPDAQFKLAGLCYRGDQVETSATEAIRWYEAAAKKGHAEAAYNLGAIYKYGLGVASNQAKADEWYTRSGNVPQGGFPAAAESTNP